MKASDLTPEDVAERIQALGHQLFLADGDPTIGGVRAHRRDGDEWGCVLFVLWHEAGLLRGLLAQGTTMAGRQARLKPARQAGVGVLLPGQHLGCWSVGRPQDRGINAHPYPCFRQAGPMAYVRDADRDAVIDLGTTGWARDAGEHSTLYQAITLGRTVHQDVVYIDGHRASAARDVDEVGPYSHLCQVWRRKSDFDAALGQVLSAVPAHGHRHSYVLLDEWGMPR